MIDRLFSLLNAKPAASAKPDRRVAIAALLVEAARRDDAFDDAERDAIARILTDRFQLTPAATQELLEKGEKAAVQSIELFSFVRGMVQESDYEERVELIEMLWDVALADGVINPYEDALIRKIAGLIYVSDFDRGAARRRVLERRGT
jgi:uncharacterized tellurite resistance protein B-like protein